MTLYIDALLDWWRVHVPTPLTGPVEITEEARIYADMKAGGW